MEEYQRKSGEVMKAIALELLADHPEEERRLVEAMPASCIFIDMDLSDPRVYIKSIALEFNRVAKRGDFKKMSDEEYYKLLEDVNLSTQFQGDSHVHTPDRMATLVTVYGKSLGADKLVEAFEAGFEFLKPSLDNIRKHL